MKVKITKSTLLFYISYIIWISMYILKATYFNENEILQVVFRLAGIPMYSLLIFKLILDNKYSLKTIIASVIFFILLIVSRNSHSRVLLETMLFIYSARNIDFKDIIKVTLFVQVTLMTITVISSLTGIIKNEVWYREDGTGRYALGYTYCTHIANFFYHIVLIYVYLKDKKKFSIFSVLTILVLNKLIYNITDTKAVYYLIIILIIISYLSNYCKINIKDNIFNKIVFKYCFALSAIISIVLSINYNPSNQLYNFLNTSLSGRLRLGNIGYQEYGISLLGQSITWVTGRQGIERAYDSVYNFVDSSYMNIAINYGIVVLILVCIGYVIIIKKLLEEKNIRGCIALLFLALHSITDPQLLLLQYNPFLLLFGSLFYEKYKYYKIQLRL